MQTWCCTSGIHKQDLLGLRPLANDVKRLLKPPLLLRVGPLSSRGSCFAVPALLPRNFKRREVGPMYYVLRLQSK